jgi:glycosyltransferase involved in cell wall biosynthesis
MTVNREKAKPHPRSTPLVSIVTPSFNQSNFIEKTILSVLKQDYKNIEYIVVDALSTDGTRQILCKYAKKLAKLIQEPDDGQSDAIDKGFRISSGEIMAYINSDDCYPSSQVISRVVELFEQNPEIDVIYGNRQFIDENGFFTLSQPHRAFDAETLKRACFIPQECVFWRRSIYEKAGNYINKNFHFAMDYDLWLRFLDCGAKFLSVDEVFGLFRLYSEQKSQSAWIKHGLPEISSLQEKYLGRRLCELEMKKAHDQYLYEMNRQDNSRIWNETHPLWLDFINAKQNWLQCCPLDIWVFRGGYAQ